MIFEWDDSKERINITKHGIDFSTAAHVFQDENRIEFYDEAHSEYEDRYITIGQINGVAIIVMVVYRAQRCDQTHFSTKSYQPGKENVL